MNASAPPRSAGSQDEAAAPVSARAAIVTGAGLGPGGLGRCIAARLVADGLSVLMADADPSVERAAQDVRERLGPEGAGRVVHFVGDLSQEAVVQAMVDLAVSRFGRLDVLVNNAGGGVILPFLEHDATTLRATIDRNLWTTLWCCHKALPVMAARNHGRIINIGADSLRTGIPNHAAYNAAKGGVIGLMVGLAKDWAHTDITVNTVSPCVINSGRFRARLQSDPAVASEFLRVVPKGRGAEVDEVADMVSFLARPEAAFITGQDFSVNGGSAMP